ncbi:MAG TPA: cadmium resistance transporter [Chloroflexota bacterium]
MDSLLGILALGAVAYVSTNVDGLVVLMVFFADSQFSPAQILAGQLAATTAWVALSTLAASAAVVVPARWLGLLGLLPILLGLVQLMALRNDFADAEEDLAHAEAEKRQSQKRTRSHVGAVALVALANGADNVAVYVSLFSTSSRGEIGTYAGLFLGLSVAWCAVAHALVHRSGLRIRLERHTRGLLPVILIALGLYILAKSVLA